MSEKDILNILEAIQKELLDIKEMVSHLPRVKVPGPLGFNFSGRKKHLFSQRLMGGLRDPEIRATIIQMRKSGASFDGIEAAIKKKWPKQPEKWSSSSAIHRFWHSALLGRLREFGIEPPIQL